MLHLADKMKILMMDDASLRAARLILGGATFWRSAGSGMTAARDAQIVNLDRRQAGQVIGLLKVEATAQPAMLCARAVPGHLQALLLDDVDAPMRSSDMEAA